MNVNSDTLVLFSPVICRHTLFLVAVLFWGSSVFAQEAVTLDTALKEGAAYLSKSIGKFGPGIFVVVNPPESEYPKVSKHARVKLNSLFKSFGKDNDFTIVNREDKAALEEEESEQANNGEEKTAKSIGDVSNPDYIVTGSFSLEGEQYTLELRVTRLGKHELIDDKSYLIKRDKVLDGLLQNLSPDDWKQHRLYLGARAGVSLPFYENGGGLEPASKYPAQQLRGSYGFDAGLYASASVWSLFEIQAEAIFTTDAFALYSGNALIKNVSYTTLMLPLLAKVVWRPSIFMVQGYGGVYVSLPLGQLAVQETNSYTANYTAPPGFVAGGGFGIKLGPGVLLADIRYAADFFNLSAQHNGTMNVSKRSKVVFSLGYEFGVIKK